MLAKAVHNNNRPIMHGNCPSNEQTIPSKNTNAFTGNLLRISVCPKIHSETTRKKPQQLKSAFSPKYQVLKYFGTDQRAKEGISVRQPTTHKRHIIIKICLSNMNDKESLIQRMEYVYKIGDTPLPTSKLSLACLASI